MSTRENGLKQFSEGSEPIKNMPYMCMSIDDSMSDLFKVYVDREHNILCLEGDAIDKVAKDITTFCRQKNDSCLVVSEGELISIQLEHITVSKVIAHLLAQYKEILVCQIGQNNIKFTGNMNSKLRRLLKKSKLTCLENGNYETNKESDMTEILDYLNGLSDGILIIR